MTETSHTPGPWRLVEDPNGWTLHANGTDITANPFDCSDADARLIAAAPEYHDAAQLILDNWEKGDLAGAVRALAAAHEKATEAL